MLSSDIVESWRWSKLSTSKLDNSYNKARISSILAELRYREVVVQLAQDALGYESAKATLKEKNSAFAFR